MSAIVRTRGELMKTTVKCGRCEAKIDIEEGMKIGTCLTPMHKKKPQAHTIEVDISTFPGIKIANWFDRRPQVQR